MAQAVAMGVAGGFVMVVFFSFWGRAYGHAHLGRIQGAAQVMTVLASAVGPLLLAWCVEATGSYAAAFYALAAVVVVLGASALVTRLPGACNISGATCHGVTRCHFSSTRQRSRHRYKLAPYKRGQSPFGILRTWQKLRRETRSWRRLPNPLRRIRRSR